MEPSPSRKLTIQKELKQKKEKHVKKEYIKPQMDILSMESEVALLSDSCQNPHWCGPWKEPEPEPEENGCQSSWWCGK